jgi:hypothetical protein
MKKFIFLFIVFCVLSSPVFGYHPALKGVIALIDTDTTNYLNDANVIAGYYMDDNNTDETDESGNSQTLTQTGGSIPTSATVPSGFSGTSRDFEYGDTEYLTQADGNGWDVSGADQSFSFFCWIDLESDPNKDQPIINKYNTTGNQRQYTFRYDDSDDALKVIISQDGTNFSIATGTIGYSTLSDGLHHVGFVYNDTAGTISIYVDASVDTNGANNPASHSAGIFDGSDPFYMGTDGGGSNFFDGLIDEPIGFDRALSGAEVSDLYTDGIDGANGGND